MTPNSSNFNDIKVVYTNLAQFEMQQIQFMAERVDQKNNTIKIMDGSFYSIVKCFACQLCGERRLNNVRNETREFNIDH